MESALKLLSVLVLCGLARGQNGSSTPATPCGENGCPNITLYLGPRWGSKVIYLGTEPRNTAQNATEQGTPVPVKASSFVNETPPITHFTFPPTITKVPNSNENSSVSPEDAAGANAIHELTSATEKVEGALLKILMTPIPDEGVEEFDFFEPNPTSIYDRESESEESFVESMRKINEFRKPVPEDGSFSIEFEEPKEDEEDVARILPNSPDFLGSLDWSGYRLTGKQVKSALYTLTPYARGRLRSLDISSNLIRDLAPLTFPSDLEDTLEQLLLDRNPVQYLSSSSRFELSRLQRLRVLSLGHTSLRSFPPLLLPSLETLYLQGNLLTEVPDTLPSIPTLAELDLSHNYITRINDPINLPHLRILKLDNNSIDHIDEDALSNCYDLQEVYLHQNPWSYDSEATLPQSRATFHMDGWTMHRDPTIFGKQFGKKPFCPSCPGLPSWVYSFTLNSSLLFVSLLVLLLAVVAIRTRLTQLPPYRILHTKSPV